MYNLFKRVSILPLIHFISKLGYFAKICAPRLRELVPTMLPSGKSSNGTSSLRRGAQILAKYPNLEIKWIRGNIDTRLNKLYNEDYDAIILAAAGLKRMGWSDDIVTTYLDKDTLVPAIGQGALGIECRADDTELLELLAKVHNEEVANCVTAERTFLKEMNGSCQVPIGGYATIEQDGIIEYSIMPSCSIVA